MRPKQGNDYFCCLRNTCTELGVPVLLLFFFLVFTPEKLRRGGTAEALVVAEEAENFGRQQIRIGACASVLVCIKLCIKT